MNELVSILIPCYNAERSIAQAIESALVQSWARKEVIVVDDGSTDRSLEIIGSFGARIHSVAGAHQGGNATRNRLLDLAHGRWVQYLDADDYLLPTKIEKQMEYALANPNCDIICSPTVWEHIENGKVVCTTEQIPDPHDPWILLSRWRLPQTGGTLWRRSVLKKVGGWKVGQTCCQEHELYCRLLEAGYRFGFCNQCLAVYRDLEYDDRVTRRSRAELDLQRIAIFDRIERCLRDQGNLTPPRREAINNARHQISRKLWLWNRELAARVLQTIHKSDPFFRPGEDPASPPLYRLIYRIFGFDWTQRIAAVTRFLQLRRLRYFDS